MPPLHDEYDHLHDGVMHIHMHVGVGCFKSLEVERGKLYTSGYCWVSQLWLA